MLCILVEVEYVEMLMCDCCGMVSGVLCVMVFGEFGCLWIVLFIVVF